MLKPEFDLELACSINNHAMTLLVSDGHCPCDVLLDPDDGEPCVYQKKKKLEEVLLSQLPI